MVGVWEGLNLGSIPNFFLCFGMHPKIIDVHPKLIPKRGVVQFCHANGIQSDFYILSAFQIVKAVSVNVLKRSVIVGEGGG